MQIYKVKSNSLISLWLAFIKNSNLLSHLNKQQKSSFILNEAATFDNLNKRSEYILSGSIEFEDSIGHFTDIDLLNPEDIKLEKLIKRIK